VESWTWLSASARQPGSSGWFLAINAEHHLRSGEDLEAMWEVRAGESGWSGPVGPIHLRVGHLVERWGKLDLLSSVNVLNPVDMRAGPLASIEATRVPLPMARIQTGGKHLRGELVLIPFAGADRADMVGGDWSIIRPGMLQGALSEAADWPGSSGALMAETVTSVETALDDMTPSTFRGLSAGLGSSGTPESTFTNGEVALRLEVEGRGFDAAFMGGALRSHRPATTLTPQIKQVLQDGEWPPLDQLNSLTAAVVQPLEIQWPRTWFAGTEASTTAGPFGVRLEGGWWSDAVVQTPWLGSATSPRISGGAGVDWMHSSILLISVEGSYTRYLDAPSQLFMMREEQLDIGGLLRWTTASDRLSLMAAGTLVPAHGEYLVRPEARYRASDQLELGLGAVMIGGQEAPPTTLRQAMGYASGPMAYFGENDTVFAQLRWIQ